MTGHRKLNLGFIGAGFIGQLAHIENYAQLDNCRLAALAERREDLRDSVARKYAIPISYADHQSLLDNPDIDAVVVVTARQHTAEIVKDCLLSGKHVFSEKPMASNLETAKSLVQLARKQGLNYCVGYMKRLDQGVIKAKILFDGLINSNEIGSLLHVKATCYMGDSYCKATGNIESKLPRPPFIEEAQLAPSWLEEDEKPVFARYNNVYSHLTNLLAYFLERSPSIEYFNYLSPLSQTCVLNYGHCLATLNTGEKIQREWEEEIEFIFEKGSLTLSLPPALLRNVPAKVSLEKAGDEFIKTKYKSDWSWAFKHQAIEFVSSCLTKTPSVISADHALTDFEVIENIWKHRSKSAR
tara:strand:- start:9578 stop:10642 length:1065 start_codon:yes stop_codon:yes gene_type:complete